jgi:hypothetical protein
MLLYFLDTTFKTAMSSDMLPVDGDLAMNEFM